MIDEPDLLNLMLDDESKQSELYKPGPYWQGYRRRIVKAIKKHGIGQFRRTPAIGKGFADVIPSDPFQLYGENNSIKNSLARMITQAPKMRSIFQLYQNQIDLYIRSYMRYKSEYYECKYKDWFLTMAKQYPLPETTHAGCLDTVAFENVAYSTLYIDFLLRIWNFNQWIHFQDMRSVMEIGGGFGAFPHLLVSMYANIKKIIYLDIPPMIYLGTQYLKHFFGAAIKDYRVTREWETIRFAENDDLEIVCLCPWQIERLDVKLDLLWNSASFSEMSPAIVENYAHYIKKNSTHNTKLCLLLNKTTPHEKYDISLPDHIHNIFLSEFQLQQMEPKLEHKFHSLYYLGVRNPTL
ncbi:MAG: putative sugar O-methyltransferase [Candidatus Omnitrophota bacterium]|jgi:putative sugar O-methyltransferase|nr:MAG: putative sugar O-methyltransferase [Candidatus Omnitrophota bacterium]